MNKERRAPIQINREDFREIGYRLVDRIAEFLDTLSQRPVTTGESPTSIRQALNAVRTLPPTGSEPGALLDHAADLLFDHSLFNGHPRFWGYITAGAAPIVRRPSRAFRFVCVCLSHPPP